jgi:hypothetical protein
MIYNSNTFWDCYKYVFLEMVKSKFWKATLASIGILPTSSPKPICSKQKRSRAYKTFYFDLQYLVYFFTKWNI